LPVGAEFDVISRDDQYYNCHGRNFSMYTHKSYGRYFMLLRPVPVGDGSFTARGIVGSHRGFATTFETGERHSTAGAALSAGIGWVKKKIDGTW
jgi:hypothetical protein